MDILPECIFLLGHFDAVGLLEDSRCTDEEQKDDILEIKREARVVSYKIKECRSGY